MYLIIISGSSMLTALTLADSVGSRAARRWVQMQPRKHDIDQYRKLSAASIPPIPAKERMRIVINHVIEAGSPTRSSPLVREQAGTPLESQAQKVSWPKSHTSSNIRCRPLAILAVETETSKGSRSPRCYLLTNLSVIDSLPMTSRSQADKASAFPRSPHPLIP